MDWHGIVVFAIACMALNILVGATGLVSFGHGAWFGLAAYAAGYLGVGLPLALAGWQAQALAVACVVQAGVALVAQGQAMPAFADDYILSLGVTWRYRNALGMEHAQQKGDYYAELEMKQGSDGGGPGNILLGRGSVDVGCVPLGNGDWLIS